MMSINNWTVQVALSKYAHEFIYFANHLHIYVLARTEPSDIKME